MEGEFSYGLAHASVHVKPHRSTSVCHALLAWLPFAWNQIIVIYFIALFQQLFKHGLN